MSFGATFKGDLISMVEVERCIWDPSCEDYKINEKKNRAWNRVMASLSAKGYAYDLGEVKVWKGLRDHWRRLNNKKTGSSTEGPWVFSKSLRFLESSEVTGSRICNFQGSCASQDILEDEENSPPLDSPSPEESSISPARRTLSATTPLSKRKRLVNVLDEEREMVRDATAAVIARLNEKANQPKDKYAIFGKFVEEFLRDLPEDAAKQKMFVINTVLFQDVVVAP